MSLILAAGGAAARAGEEVVSRCGAGLPNWRLLSNYGFVFPDPGAPAGRSAGPSPGGFFLAATIGVFGQPSDQLAARLATGHNRAI